MRSTLSLAALALILSVASAGDALAEPGTRGIPGFAVSPGSVRLESLPRAVPPTVPTIREIPEGEVPMGHLAFEEMKRTQVRVKASELSEVTIDAGAPRPALLAPTLGNGFEGITQNGYIPSEPTVAAGPLNIFSAGNVTVTVTDKDGSNRVEIDGATFFGAPASEGAISDAVCYYDALRGRFLALSFTQGNSGGTKWSYFYLAISKTSDARGGWWLYKFDQRMDGTTLTSNWSDFEGLGVSDDKLAMSSQQFSFGANQYKYQKVRVIDRALAYAGAPVAYVDLVNFPAPPGGDVGDLFVTKVGRNISAGDNTIHCLNTRYNGGSRVTYRAVTGSPGSPVISSGVLVTVNSYSVPPGAAQLGSANLVNTGDCRMSSFYVRDGIISAAWHFGIDFGSGSVDAVRLLRLRASDHAVLTDETFGADGVFYYYPAVTVDSVGTVFLGFDRSSASEYPSAYATGKRRSDSTLEPSVLLKAGLAATSQTRWGDYTGIDMDQSAFGPSGSSAWYAGQWVKSSNVFGTWINRLTFSFGTIAGTVLDDCDGSTSTIGDRTPLAGATVTLRQGATVLATTSSDGAGAFSFGYLESGTYDIVVAPPVGATAVDAVPGSGGSSQTRVSATDIQVALTASQASSSNVFLMTTAHPVPVTSGISPSSKNQGDAAFAMTVMGSAFIPCSVVRLDGGDRSTAFVSPTQLSASIPASDMSGPGTHSITVFNRAPSGGTSNAQTFTVNAVDVTPPSVTVSAPNGGEIWKAGSSHNILWNATDDVGVTAVDVAYSTDGGATFPNGIATGFSNTGSFTWTVPNTPTLTARVRVTAHDAAGHTGADASNANFTIDRWIITATAGSNGTIAPSGPVPVVQGASQSFTITPDTGYGIADVLVDGSSVGAVGSYTLNNVIADHTISASFAANIYTLTTTSVGVGGVTRNPNQPSYAYGTSVELTAVPGTGWAFVSWSGNATGSANPLTVLMDAAKIITATFADSARPSVVVTSPNGGELLSVGSAADLRWTATDNVGVATVHLLLSRAGAGGPFDTLATGIVNSGTFSWIVSGPVTTDAFLKAVAIDSVGNAGVDLSDAAFSIVDATTAVDLLPVSEFALAPVWPNPGHGTVEIEYAVPREAPVTLAIIDVTGREMSRLAEGVHAVGRYRLVWDGNSNGRRAAAGLYFVCLQTPSRTFVRRMVFMR